MKHHSMLLFLTVALGPTVVAGTAPSPPTPTYIVRNLGTLGGSFTNVRGFNNRGEAVGVSATADDEGHAFIWWNGVMTDLGEGGLNEINACGDAAGYVRSTSGFQAVLSKDGVQTDLGTFGDYHNSSSSFINERGQVVVDVWTGTISGSFLWDRGSRIDLGPLQARDFNDRGEVVGDLFDGDEYHGVMWRDGVNTVLIPSDEYTGSWVRDINNHGQAVGACVSPDAVHACVWTRAEVRDLGALGSGWSAAFGINDRGQIVGYSQTGEGEIHAVLWTDGEMIDLGTLGGELSVAFRINDRGQVLGSSTTASGESHLFLWEKGVMVDLWPWARTPSGGFSLVWAMHLNARGEVVGPCLTAEDQVHACIRQLEGGSAPR